MNWLRQNRRTAWIIGLTLLVPLLLYINALFGLMGLRNEYQSDIDSLQPRIARLTGLLEFEQQLSTAAVDVEQQLARLVYPPSADPPSLSAALQNDVRQIFAEAGMSVSNSQVLATRQEQVFDLIGLKLTVVGTVEGLDAALLAVADHSPLLLVESLEVWPARASRRKKDDEKKIQQSVSASLQLLSLRAVR